MLSWKAWQQIEVLQKHWDTDQRATSAIRLQINQKQAGRCKPTHNQNKNDPKSEMCPLMHSLTPGPKHLFPPNDLYFNSNCLIFKDKALKLALQLISIPILCHRLLLSKTEQQVLNGNIRTATSTNISN